MPTPITRRHFLKSAGGITFLALVPMGRGLFAAPTDTGPALPLFTALPYIQPGNNSRLIQGKESITIAWQTDATTADFTLEYGLTSNYNTTAHVQCVTLKAATQSAAGFNYAATLADLQLSKRYFYRLSGNGRVIVEGQFSTRKQRGETTRFVSFGDNANGSAGERAVAFYAYQAHPDFIMNTGDNVYESGLNRQYIQNFFPIYNADTANVKVGGPILRSVPFYSVIANHDVNHHGPGHQPAANFDKEPDSLSYYTNLYMPMNGLTPPPQKTILTGAADKVQDFLDAAGQRYPTMANYSYDYGDAHFLCLDSNLYIDPTNAALQKWIRDDLMQTDAPWKFVVFHHPGYNVGPTHYNEQHMRVLSPLFEACGVDICLHGHEHTYQRTMPMRFAPTDSDAASLRHGNIRLVPGTFTVDRAFDGKTKTKPDGIVYITTGAGGQELYDPGFDEAPEKWLHPEDNKEAYIARFVSAQHSLTVIDIDGKNLTMRQIGEDGQELDSIRITKS